MGCSAGGVFCLMGWGVFPGGVFYLGSAFLGGVFCLVGSFAGGVVK